MNLSQLNTEELPPLDPSVATSSYVPFYTEKDSILSVASQWNLEQNLSLVAYEHESTYTYHLTSQCPEIVVIGVDHALLHKRVIARVAGLRNRPIIIALVESNEKSLLTACYQQSADRVIAIPDCSARIFRAQITALQKREIYYPPYRFNITTRTCNIGNQAVSLTTKTFDVAQYLFANQGKLISKSIILKDLWGLKSEESHTRRIEAHMSRVRRLLLLDGSLGWEIRSRRREGYGVFQIARDNS